MLTPAQLGRQHLREVRNQRNLLELVGPEETERLQEEPDPVGRGGQSIAEWSRVVVEWSKVE